MAREQPRTPSGTGAPPTPLHAGQQEEGEERAGEECAQGQPVDARPRAAVPADVRRDRIHEHGDASDPGDGGLVGVAS